jgi:hypothetical protein
VRYIVEYIGSDLRLYGKEFDDFAVAAAFADGLAQGFYDFYAEAIKAEADKFSVRSRVERYRKLDGKWMSVGP